MGTGGYTGRARWDAESRTWWTDGEDIPGLCCQAATFEELVDLVFALAPDLLAAKGAAASGQTIEIPIRVMAERHGSARFLA
ncbi:MAG: DUF1902 domain-containing protein [Pseudomonadota bacterium]